MSKERLLDCYRRMVLIRKFEERAGQLYGMGKIAGFCHLYIGQEAVAVGVYNAMEKDDKVITAYRDHGLILEAGMDPKFVMAELMGRINGCSKGKGGSMHTFDLSNNFYGGHGIVGAQISLGTGIGFAEKYKGANAVSLTFFGDGAANQGQVYESFNMASLWKLPVLYIIENNQYAMGTSQARHSATLELFTRGECYGIPGRKVDGMDMFRVEEATKEALDYIRSGKGPMILEMDTYRYRGHSMSDPATYRDKEEIEQYRGENDPILNLARHIKEKNIATEEELKELEKLVKTQMKEVVEFCEVSPEPDESELYTDVYIEGEGQ